MKKFNVIFFLLISYISVNGQEYLPMLEENTVWSIMHEKHTLIGDTIINELTYKKLYFHNYLEDFTPDSLIYIAAMREDETNEKVYFIWMGHEEEFLLYDFSLEVGSEFVVISPLFWLAGPEFQDDWGERIVEVSAVFYQNIAGKDRKTIKVGPNYNYEYWIEGLGSSKGLIYAGASGEDMLGRDYPFLLCIHVSDSLIYQEDDPWGITPDTCYAMPFLNIDEVSRYEYKLIAIPSLFRDSFVIQSDCAIEKVTVYNIMGRTVFEFRSKELFTQKEIFTTNWDKGLYIIRAENQSGTAILKIIKY
jgi:hypothetical protein